MPPASFCSALHRSTAAAAAAARSLARSLPCPGEGGCSATARPALPIPDPRAQCITGNAIRSRLHVGLPSGYRLCRMCLSNQNFFLAFRSLSPTHPRLLCAHTSFFFLSLLLLFPKDFELKLSTAHLLQRFFCPEEPFISLVVAISFHIYILKNVYNSK